jgi:hypothetical protein
MGETSILDGVVIGAFGGAFAGITVWIVQLAHMKISESCNKARVYRWLRANTSEEDGKRYRSTRAIASWNNLTEDRVRYVCSLHDQIYLSTGPQEDLWSLYERGDRSVY